MVCNTRVTHFWQNATTDKLVLVKSEATIQFHRIEMVFKIRYQS